MYEIKNVTGMAGFACFFYGGQKKKPCLLLKDSEINMEWSRMRMSSRQRNRGELLVMW